MRAEHTYAQEQHGMTLVEVLVALAVLGAVAGATLILIGQNSRFIASAEDRLIASMLVDNELTESLATRQELETGVTEERVVFAGGGWILQREVTEAGVENIVRIDVAVRREGEDRIAARASTLKKEGD